MSLHEFFVALCISAGLALILALAFYGAWCLFVNYSSRESKQIRDKMRQRKAERKCRDGNR